MTKRVAVQGWTWIFNTFTKKRDAYFKFPIAKTVLFKDGDPIKLFFNSEDGVVHRTNAKFTDRELAEIFLSCRPYKSNLAKFFCVARFRDEEGKVEARILTDDDFDKLLGPNGQSFRYSIVSLQQYIHCKGGSGSVYRVEYSSDESKQTSLQTKKVAYLTVPTKGKVSVHSLPKAQIVKSNARKWNTTFEQLTEILVRRAESSSRSRVVRLVAEYMVDENGEPFFTHCAEVALQRLPSRPRVKPTITPGGHSRGGKRCEGVYCHDKEADNLGLSDSSQDQRLATGSAGEEDVKLDGGLLYQLSYKSVVLARLENAIRDPSDSPVVERLKRALLLNELSGLHPAQFYKEVHVCLQCYRTYNRRDRRRRKEVRDGRRMLADLRTLLRKKGITLPATSPVPAADSQRASGEKTSGTRGGGGARAHQQNAADDESSDGCDAAGPATATLESFDASLPPTSTMLNTHGQELTLLGILRADPVAITHIKASITKQLSVYEEAHRDLCAQRARAAEKREKRNELGPAGSVATSQVNQLVGALGGDVSGAVSPNPRNPTVTSNAEQVLLGGPHDEHVRSPVLGRPVEEVVPARTSTVESDDEPSYSVPETFEGDAHARAATYTDGGGMTSDSASDLAQTVGVSHPHRVAWFDDPSDAHSSPLVHMGPRDAATAPGPLSTDPRASGGRMPATHMQPPSPTHARAQTVSGGVGVGVGGDGGSSVGGVQRNQRAKARATAAAQALSESYPPPSSKQSFLADDASAHGPGGFGVEQDGD
eukprot:Rmarinus@m.26698